MICENPSMRAIAKILQALTSEQQSNFLREKSSKGQILRALENFYHHSIPLTVVVYSNENDFASFSLNFIPPHTVWYLCI